MPGHQSQERYYTSFTANQIPGTPGVEETYSGELLFIPEDDGFSLLPREEQLQRVGSAILRDLYPDNSGQITITFYVFELIYLQ